MFGSGDDFLLGVSNRCIATRLDALDRDVAVLGNGIAANSGKALIAIATVGRGENLNIAIFGG